MRIQEFGIPKPGMRNIKTAVSVFLCLVLFRFLNKPYPIYACIAAIICTKDTIWNSYNASRSRIIGTVIGGLLGGIFLKLIQEFYFFLSFEIIAVSGIILLIYIFNLIDEKDSAALACVVYILLIINFQYSWEVRAPYSYAFERTIETSIGIVISLLVNRYIFPYRIKKKEGERNLYINYKTKLYGLIGDPVEKSLSPDIHNKCFNNNDINAVYLAFNIHKDELSSAIDGIRSLDIKGFNITIPHKVSIIDYLDELDEEAKILGAVNTVKNIDGRLIGYNTDGRGFIELLKEEDFNPKDKKIVVLGAGGASRAITMSLAKEGVSDIIILNRTEDKAIQLKEEIESNFKRVNIETKDLDSFEDIDLIVNTTSVGMYPDTDKIPFDIDKLSDKTVVADIVYKPLKTKFLKKAEERGLKTIGGIGMLINQAILSEEIWLDKEIDKLGIEEDIKNILREENK
ncbi:MAG: shikimate dehydrogenase [Andreesenia angusta]|nr:shikimate dehydrogenase [Andreesenia angusta]